MRAEEGGVRQETRPRTKTKYMGECRGIFGVMMRKKTDDIFEGDRMQPLDYTGQKVIGPPVAYKIRFNAEVRRVVTLKITGTSSSVHWKDAGLGLPGGPYQTKYGNRWKEKVCEAIDKGSNAVRNVTDLMDRCIQEARKQV